MISHPPQTQTMMGRSAKNCFRSRRLRYFRLSSTGALSLTALVSLWSPSAVRSLTNLHAGGRRCIQRSPPAKRQAGRSVVGPSLATLQRRWLSNDSAGNGAVTSQTNGEQDPEEWQYLLPFEDGSHNSAKIVIPPLEDEIDDNDDNVFEQQTFLDRLNSTVLTLRQLEKSSLWVDVHISRSSFIEDMAKLGFHFHHAQGDNAVLNLWLKEEIESLVPEFATHHIGVGGLVINSRDEILCVRELRRNFMPWKIPGGLSNLGEHIDEAVVREVFEETGIRTTFRNVICFRHTHGMAFQRSDLYFVCRLDPIEEVDEDGNVVIPEPVAQEAEIEATAWVPYSEFRDMVNGEDGHPMISHVLNLNDRGDVIDRKVINSIVPGRKASPIYSSPAPESFE